MTAYHNPRHESRHLECERHPGARLPGPRVAGARATGRGVSAGTEGRGGPDPGRMQARRISCVLARPEGLFRRGAPDSSRARRRRSGVRASAVRHRIPHRAGRARRSGHRVRLRPERREGLCREAAVPGATHGLGTPALRRGTRAIGVRRHQYRAHGARRSPQGAQAQRDRPAARGAGAARDAARHGPYRRGAVVRSRQSAGVWTMCWRHGPWRPAPRAAWSRRTWARATTHR
jgi:hypothetical protein